MTARLYDRMYAALTAAQTERPKRQDMSGDEPEWVRYERNAMWTEVNAARAERDLPGVLLADILRVEEQAVGHSDYTAKYALYCAELAEDTTALDITDYLVVHHYRRDQGDWAWLYRCWGDGGCDGHLSLDWSSRTSAERQARQHLAEHHTAAPAKEGGPNPQ